MVSFTWNPWDQPSTNSLKVWSSRLLKFQWQTWGVLIETKVKLTFFYGSVLYHMQLNCSCKDVFMECKKHHKNIHVNDSVYLVVRTNSRYMRIYPQWIFMSIHLASVLRWMAFKASVLVTMSVLYVQSQWTCSGLTLLTQTHPTWILMREKFGVQLPFVYKLLIWIISVIL